VAHLLDSSAFTRIPLWRRSVDKRTTLFSEVDALLECGGAGGIRTPYLFDANEALSQLSYSPGFTYAPAGTGMCPRADAGFAPVDRFPD
jgi:hypothetical protein